MSFIDFLNESKIKLGKASKVDVNVDGEEYSAIRYELPDGYMVTDDPDDANNLAAASKLFGEDAVGVDYGLYGGEEDYGKVIEFKLAKLPMGYKMKDNDHSPVLAVIVAPTTLSKSDVEKFVNKVLKPIEMEVSPKISAKADQGMGFWSDLRKGKM